MLSYIEAESKRLKELVRNDVSDLSDHTTNVANRLAQQEAVADMRVQDERAEDAKLGQQDLALGSALDSLTSLHSKTVNSVSDLDSDLQMVKDTQRVDREGTKQLGDAQGSYAPVSFLRVVEEALSRQVEHLVTRTSLLEGALSGDVQVKLFPDDIELAASELNATTEYNLPVFLQVCSSSGEVHTWLNVANPAITPSKGTVDDSDVSAPTILEETVAMVAGKLMFTLQMDVGAGKTYVAGEELSCDIKLNADNKIGAVSLGETKVAITIV